MGGSFEVHYGVGGNVRVSPLDGGDGGSTTQGGESDAPTRRAEETSSHGLRPSGKGDGVKRSSQEAEILISTSDQILCRWCGHGQSVSRMDLKE